MSNSYYNIAYWRMWESQTHNIVIGNVSQEDKELFFGPIFDFDEFKSYDEEIRFPQLLRDLGLFRSSSEARKNGWNKDIPEGWFEATIGKKKTKLYILKLTKEDQ